MCVCVRARAPPPSLPVCTRVCAEEHAAHSRRRQRPEEAEEEEVEARLGWTRKFKT